MGKVEARKEGSDSVETFLVQLQVTLLNTPFPMSQAWENGSLLTLAAIWQGWCYYTHFADALAEAGGT